MLDFVEIFEIFYILSIRFSYRSPFLPALSLSFSCRRFASLPRFASRRFASLRTRLFRFDASSAFYVLEEVPLMEPRTRWGRGRG